MPTYTLTLALPGGHTLTVTDTDPVSLRAAVAQVDPRDLLTLTPAAPPTPPGTPGPPAAAAAPVCPHGPRVHRTGTSARGPWAAWMCPAPKDTPGRCDPLWVD